MLESTMAFPEVCKKTSSVTVATGLAKQYDAVLWIGNRQYYTSGKQFETERLIEKLT